MKNLKYITLAFVALIGLTTFTSCEDEDKHRFPMLANGGFIKFVSLPEFNAGADPATAAFEAMTEDPNQNVASFDLSVRGRFTGATSDTIPFRSATSFPFDVGFTGADMATLFNVDITTFAAGDSFEFFGIVTTTDGRVFNFTQTDCDCPTPGDGEVVVEDPGTWNGGTADGVLNTAATLLSAMNYTVTFNDPPM